MLGWSPTPDYSNRVLGGVIGCCGGPSTRLLEPGAGMSNRVLFVLTGFGVALLLAVEANATVGWRWWMFEIPSLALAACCGTSLGEVVRDWMDEH